MESNLNQFQSIRDGIQLKIITGKYHRFQYSTLPPASLLPPSSPPHKTVKSDKSNAILFVFINRLGKISRDCCRNGSNILRLLPIKKNRRRDSVAVIALNHPHQYTNCLRVCVCVCVWWFDWRFQCQRWRVRWRHRLTGQRQPADSITKRHRGAINIVVWVTFPALPYQHISSPPPPLIYLSLSFFLSFFLFPSAINNILSINNQSFLSNQSNKSSLNSV